MNIGTAAKKSGLPPKTIRYYESVGLLGATRRQPNGYRIYDPVDVRIMQFVGRARGLGFNIDDVAELLTLWCEESRSSAQVKALALRRVEQIDRKIRELATLKRAVLDLSERCHGDNRPECPILDELSGTASGEDREPREARSK